MSRVDGLVNALISGGIGAAITSVAVAAIQVMGRRGESRAIAADRLTNASVSFADRLDTDNKRLTAENKNMRRALSIVTDVLDDIIPLLQVEDAVRDRLREANHEAKQVI